VSHALLEGLFNVFLAVLFFLLGLKARTYRSGGVSANNSRRRTSEGQRSKGFWRRLFGVNRGNRSLLALYL
jgi:hypothetical protein